MRPLYWVLIGTAVIIVIGIVAALIADAVKANMKRSFKLDAKERSELNILRNSFNKIEAEMRDHANINPIADIVLHEINLVRKTIMGIKEI